jgi:hypothetical protein
VTVGTLAWLCAAAGIPRAEPRGATEPLFSPRVVDVRIDGVSLDRVDVSLQMAVRASRTLPIRSLKFSDGAIDRIPESIAPLEGRWPLRRGEELVIPERIAVTAYARDAVGVASFAELMGRAEVDARAVVELSFDTPWLTRVFGMATGVAITEVAFKAPVPATALPLPLAQLGAGVLDFLQRQAGALVAAGPGGQAGDRDVVDRFGRAVATVETEYEIAGAMPVRRASRLLGVWWTPSVYCTTREAIEPWRYSPADAALLQLEGGRLREVATRIRRGQGTGSPIALDAGALRRALGTPEERRVYSLGTGEPRRIRLAVRAARSALICVQVGGDDGPALPAGAATATAAAFIAGAPPALVWTDTTPAGSMLTLRTPLYRRSFGSPLVTADAVIGLVASPDMAWDAGALAAAAARPLRLRPPR